MKTLKTISFLTGSLFFFAFTSESSSWKLKFEGRSVEVFKRKIETKIDEYKLVGSMNASLLHLSQYLDRTEEIKKWFPACDRAELIEQINPDEKIVRVVLNLPFPARDRDAIVHVRRMPTPDGQLKYIVTNRADYVPQVKKFVRIPHIACTMTVSGASEYSSVTQVSSFDMGGALPEFILNMLFPKTMAKSFVNLQTALK